MIYQSVMGFVTFYLYSCLFWMNQLFKKAILSLGPVSSG